MSIVRRLAGMRSPGNMTFSWDRTTRDDCQPTVRRVLCLFLLRGDTPWRLIPMANDTSPRSTQAPTAFDCQMCGHCCEGRGGIVLAAKDRARLAEHLGLEVDAFLERYAEELNGKLVLRVNADGFCVFFGKGCSVHQAKPDICRAWPFFRGNLVDELSWRMAQEYCPGINPAAGHAEFVRQGLAHLASNRLLDSAEDVDGPAALKL